MATIDNLTVELQSTRQRLGLSEAHGMKFSENIDNLRKETDQGLREANNNIAEL